jgi:hypothetical protein
VGPRAGLDHVEKRKFWTLTGLELRPLGRQARGQSLYRLRYPGSRTTQNYIPEDRTVQRNVSSEFFMVVMIMIVVLWAVMSCEYQQPYFNVEPQNFNLEDEGKLLLRNVAVHSQNYMMQEPRSLHIGKSVLCPIKNLHN